MTRQHREHVSGLVLLAGLLLAGHLAGATPAAGDGPSRGQRHVIDHASSRVSVETKTSGLSSLFGHDHRFDAEVFAGQIEIDLARPGRSRLELTVQADSLRLREDVTLPVRQEIEETVRSKVLEASRHPVISFRSHSVSSRQLDPETFKVTVRGELRLHGVSRPVVIPARVTVRAGKIWAVGSVPIRQSDFGIEPLSFGGGVSVSDQVEISFDVVAAAERPPSHTAGN